MSDKAKLTERTRDSEGNAPDVSWIGKRIRHTGNGKVYEILNFVWMGESDRWGFLHKTDEVLAVLCVRPLSHFYGKRSNGEARYIVQ